MLFELSTEILIKIQEYLTEIELYKLPKEIMWIENLKFPYRYPILKYDIKSFGKWILSREKILDQSVKKIVITNHNFLNNSIFIKTLERILSFSKIESISLHQFRSNYLIFDSISVSVCQLFKKKLNSLKKIKYLSIDPEFLIHLNSQIKIDNLSLGFYYSTFNNSFWNKSYLSETSKFALRFFLEKLKKSNGHVKNLNINLCLMDYQKFNFLFDENIYKVIKNINFQQVINAKDTILMIWKENNVNYSFSNTLNKTF